MALKFKLDSIEGLDETISGLYSEQNGKYFLNVEGAVSTDKLKEFRDNNIQLTEDLKKYKDVDLDVYNNQNKVIQELKQKKSGMSEEEVNTMVGDRVKKMKNDYEGKIKDLSKTNGVLNSQLEVLVIDNTVRTAATTHKVLDTAIDDVVLRAKSTFQMKDGVAKSYDRDGNVVFGKDGETPLTVNEWVKDLNKSAPHLFTPSTGSGSQQQRGNGKAGENLSSLGKISQGLDNQ